MKIVIQRVRNAAVIVREKEEAAIRKGLLLLIGIDRFDAEETIQQAAEKILKMRIFEDKDGKMNRSVLDIDGEVLLVPNFTLSADTEKGNRPGFGKAAPPDEAEKIFDKMVSSFSKEVKAEKGIFGANMQIELLNEGPVTFTLEL